jgi:ribosomal protein L11 methyltransferase
MKYIQIAVPVTGPDTKDILIAMLHDMQYEGFEEDENLLKAFIPEADFNQEELEDLLDRLALRYSSVVIPQQNWNARWEADFQPVIIADFCTIRAHFHQLPLATKYEIVITPKMSFGTGHHATTRLMVEQMALINFNEKRVLDFGTGTGVLAILAAQLGATDVIAIDNDEWSYDNAVENTHANRQSDIEVRQAILDDLDGTEPFDVILANINRHILLQYMEAMRKLLKEGGILLMSGLLREDESVIAEAAIAAGFTIDHVVHQGNWIAVKTHL